MDSIHSSTVSMYNEQQQAGSSELLTEEERGMLGLRQLMSMVSRIPTVPGYQQTEPRVSISENTLRLLRDWLSESPGSASNILWLSELPALLTTGDIVALCHGYCLLVATFSFSSRKGSEQVQEMITSLAVQISSNIPTLGPIIGLTVDHFPNVFSASLSDQLEALIFNPFRRYVSPSQGGLPLILLIDGLELYHDAATQRTLVSSIETIATTSSIPLRFLLTSRQSSQEYALPLQLGTYLHLRNGLSGAPLRRLQSALRLNVSQRPKISDYHGFPQLLQTRGSKSEAESYARSLIMLGHGMALWHPQGHQVAHTEYTREGPQIGDIMYMTREGGYQFLVNIFCSPDAPVNTIMSMQGQYSPLVLDPSEVTRTDDYFKPGTVITSTGVVALKHCEKPLSVNFKSKADEGGILILPEGASREDIKSTQRFHKYVQRWAPYWYRRLNVPNGSIFMVTGCDKASDYACATFYSDPSWVGAREIDMDYVGHKDSEDPWDGFGHASAHCYRWLLGFSDMRSNLEERHEQKRHLCVFVRGMRIALSSPVWTSYHTSLFARESVAYSNVLYKSPRFTHAAESLLVRLRCRTGEREALSRVLPHNNIFHPIFALAPELLQRYPKASCVVLNDSDWSILTEEGPGDWIQMKSLIGKLYRQFIVVEDEGIVFLSQKPTDHNNMNDTPPRVSIKHLFRRNNEAIKPIPVGKFVHDLWGNSDSDSD